MSATRLVQQMFLVSFNLLRNERNKDKLPNIIQARSSLCSIQVKRQNRWVLIGVYDSLLRLRFFVRTNPHQQIDILHLNPLGSEVTELVQKLALISWAVN